MGRAGRSACPILEIRVSDGRLGRAASPLFLHFDHREAGNSTTEFGHMVEARSLRVALNARMHALPAAARLRAGDGRGGSAR